MIYLKTTLCLTLALATSGCGLARVYNKVELGEPLPPDLGLTEVIPTESDSKRGPVIGERIFDMYEYYVWHTPLTTSLHRLTVLTDAEGKVTARMHDTTTLTNLLVAVGASATHVLEVAIPAELAANPKAVTLYQIMRKARWGRMFEGHVPEAAAKALTLTGYGNEYVTPAIFVLWLFDRDTDGYVASLPLSSVLEPDYRETGFVHSTGFITVTNLGDRLRIETNTWIVTDPSGMTGMVAYNLIHGMYGSSPHED
jgi:hypothetical protein